jgi:hypothetical protein
MMQEYAKTEICNCNTASELIMKAELLIEETWLDRVDALPGNLFCLGAFGEIIDSPDDNASVRSRAIALLKAYSKIIGCVLIILIQLTGAPLIFFSRMPGNMGVLDEKKYEWRCHPWLASNDTDSLGECPSGRSPMEVNILDDWLGETMPTRTLGIVFILAFIFNALIVVIEEKQTWRDLYNTFRFLDWKNEKFSAPGGIFLGTGAFVNCWVVVWTCMDMYIVVGASETPQDLLLDALGLLFLYKLDDVAGDLQFVEEDDWPGDRIAWIYKELVHPWPDEEFDEDKLDNFGSVWLLLYNVTVVLICLMLFCVPVAAVLTPFRDIAPDD